MILDILLGNYSNINEINFEEFEKLLNDASKQASRMERQADVAEYDGNRLAIIKSMKDDIGYEYDATVLNIGEKIRLKVNGIDCFIGYRNLSKDFNYDESTGKYYDRNNNMILKLGANVKVILNSVNLNNRTIDVNIIGVIKSKTIVRKR